MYNGCLENNNDRSLGGGEDMIDEGGEGGLDIDDLLGENGEDGRKKGDISIEQIYQGRQCRGNSSKES